MKRQTNPHEYFIDPTNCPWIFEDVPQGDEEVNKRIKQKYIYLNKLPSLFKYIFFCFILLFTSSSLAVRISPVAASYFSKSLYIVPGSVQLINCTDPGLQVYNREIQHHSLVCCCGLADILYSVCI